MTLFIKCTKHKCNSVHCCHVMSVDNIYSRSYLFNIAYNIICISNNIEYFNIVPEQCHQGSFLKLEFIVWYNKVCYNDD